MFLEVRRVSHRRKYTDLVEDSWPEPLRNRNTRATKIPERVNFGRPLVSKLQVYSECPPRVGHDILGQRVNNQIERNPMSNGVSTSDADVACPCLGITVPYLVEKWSHAVDDLFTAVRSDSRWCARRRKGDSAERARGVLSFLVIRPMHLGATAKYRLYKGDPARGDKIYGPPLSVPPERGDPIA